MSPAGLVCYILWVFCVVISETHLFKIGVYRHSKWPLLSSFDNKFFQRLIKHKGGEMRVCIWEMLQVRNSSSSIVSKLAITVTVT